MLTREERLKRSRDVRYFSEHKVRIWVAIDFIYKESMSYTGDDVPVFYYRVFSRDGTGFKEELFYIEFSLDEDVDIIVDRILNIFETHATVFITDYHLHTRKRLHKDDLLEYFAARRSFTLSLEDRSLSFF